MSLAKQLAQCGVAMTNIVQMGKFLSPEYFGGIEVITELSAKALTTEHRVTLICHSSDRLSREEFRDGYRVIRSGTQFKKFSQPVSLGMGFALRRAKPDLIHFHAPNFWAALMIELFCPRTDVIITHHADVEGRGALKRWLLPIYHRLAKRAKSIIVNSLKNIAYSRDLPKDLKRVVAIPYGLNEAKYRLNDVDINRSRSIKKEMFGDKVVIGFVGRLVWYKGLPTLIEAISKNPNVALLVVGDGPLKSRLMEQADSLNFIDRIHFTGAVSDEDKLRYLHAMDVFVLPSTHITEAYGISQIEAMLCGVPVISTSLPTGVSDVSVDGETGLVVTPGDIDELSAAIERLASDPSLRAQLGAQARERAIRNFSETSYMMKLREEVAENMRSKSLRKIDGELSTRAMVQSSVP